MPDAGPGPYGAEAAACLEALMREDRGRLLAALIRQLRDFQLAEEALQEALASAVVHWGRVGPPANPKGWLLRVGLRKAIDRLRKAARQGRHAAEFALLAEAEAEDMPEIPDERLRLIFTCCHPALEQKSRVALTLRTLGGLSTPEIARAFLDNDTTMGQRISRAKAKIATAGIPFAVPGAEDWAERLGSVLAVVYLIFNAGYTLGPEADRDLCAEAIWLARMLDRLRPDEPEIIGSLALLLITHARGAARMDGAGATVPLDRQDRTLWNWPMIEEGRALIGRAMALGAPGPYQVKAAIAACHVRAEGPDWPQIVMLYDGLLRMEPTSVVGLNRAVALAEAGHVEAGLNALLPLAAELAGYQPFHAARASLLARTGRIDEARTAYDRAIALAASSADAAFLRARRAGLSQDD